MKNTRSTSHRETHLVVAEVEWVLLDTETIGLSAQIFVVEVIV